MGFMPGLKAFTAAVLGGNALVTLHAVAGRLLAAAGAPPAAIAPLRARTVGNG